MILADTVILLGLLIGFVSVLCVGFYSINNVLKPTLSEWRGRHNGFTHNGLSHRTAETDIEVQYRPSVSRIPVRG